MRILIFDLVNLKIAIIFIWSKSIYSLQNRLKIFFIISKYLKIGDVSDSDYIPILLLFLYYLNNLQLQPNCCISCYSIRSWHFNILH